MHPHTRRPLWARRTFAALGLVAAVAIGLVACAAAEGGIGLPPGLSGLASSSDDGVDSIDDGYIATGESVSIFDDTLPAVSKLDPGLRAAVEAAVTAAGADGVEMVVSSGWRSARYQQWLLDEATITYGSLEEARKGVNTPDLSAHVTGNAVDIGYTDADSWLSQHGADYGLCQIYGNEMWHFELAVEPGGECPAQINNAAG